VQCVILWAAARIKLPQCIAAWRRLPWRASTGHTVARGPQGTLEIPLEIINRQGVGCPGEVQLDETQESRVCTGVGQLSGVQIDDDFSPA
jgi:hypothetical protein